MTAYHTEDINRAGLAFRVEHHSDDTMGAPWDEHNNSGVVECSHCNGSGKEPSKQEHNQ